MLKLHYRENPMTEFNQKYGFELIQGEEYLVADTEIHWELEWRAKFVITNRGFHYFESGNTLHAYKLIREIKPEYYTAETFPKGEVWLRLDNEASERMILMVVNNGIKTLDTTLYYKELYNYEISTDGRASWEKAVPTSETLDIKRTDLSISSSIKRNGNWGKLITVITITHIPTGIAVSSSAERSIHKNKLRCMELLKEQLKNRIPVSNKL